MQTSELKHGDIVGRHADSQTCRQTDRQTYRQTDRQTDIQADRHVDMQTHRLVTKLVHESSAKFKVTRKADRSRRLPSLLQAEPSKL